MTVPQCRKALLIISKGQPPSPYQLYTNGQGALPEQKSPVGNSGFALKKHRQSVVCVQWFFWERSDMSLWTGLFPVCDLVLTFSIIHNALQQVSKKI